MAINGYEIDAAAGPPDMRSWDLGELLTRLSAWLHYQVCFRTDPPEMTRPMMRPNGLRQWQHALLPLSPSLETGSDTHLRLRALSCWLWCKWRLCQMYTSKFLSAPRLDICHHSNHCYYYWQRTNTSQEYWPMEWKWQECRMVHHRVKSLRVTMLGSKTWRVNHPVKLKTLSQAKYSMLTISTQICFCFSSFESMQPQTTN